LRARAGTLLAAGALAATFFGGAAAGIGGPPLLVLAPNQVAFNEDGTRKGDPPLRKWYSIHRWRRRSQRSSSRASGTVTQR
jgi:hypothetical protein